MFESLAVEAAGTTYRAGGGSSVPPPPNIPPRTGSIQDSFPHTFNTHYHPLPLLITLGVRREVLILDSVVSSVLSVRTMPCTVATSVSLCWL